MKKTTYTNLLEKLNKKEKAIIREYINHKINKIIEKYERMHLIVYYYLLLIITILNFILILNFIPLLVAIKGNVVLLTMSLMALIIGIAFNFFVTQIEAINKRQYFITLIIFIVITLLAFLLAYYFNFNLVSNIKKKFLLALLFYIFFFIFPYPFFEITTRMEKKAK